MFSPCFKKAGQELEKGDVPSFCTSIIIEQNLKSVKHSSKLPYEKNPKHNCSFHYSFANNVAVWRICEVSKSPDD